MKNRIPRLVPAVACIIFTAGVPIPLANLQINIIAIMNAYKIREKKVMSAAASAASEQQLHRNNLSNFLGFDHDLDITAIGLFVTCPKMLKTTRFFSNRTSAFHS
jgi:hypothetical protein